MDVRCPCLPRVRSVCVTWLVDRQRIRFDEGNATMKIDWSALGLVAVVTVAATVVVVGVFSLGIAALTVSENRAGTSGASTAKGAAYACFAVAAAIVLYGLYLIIPQFH